MNDVTKFVPMLGEEPKNLAFRDTMEIIHSIKVIDTSTHAEVVDCRLYSGRSRNASVVRCAIWIRSLKAGIHVYGVGRAGGHGYDKKSAAIAAALESAGFAMEENVSGRGMSMAILALEAVAAFLDHDTLTVQFYA